MEAKHEPLFAGNVKHGASFVAFAFTLFIREHPIAPIFVDAI